MKKTILFALGGFLIGAFISPITGMAISSTRNLILGMAPEEAILALADKIDQESGRNDEQEQKISDLQGENNIQKEAVTKQQEKTNCELKKRDCTDKIKPIQSKVESAKKTISSIKEAKIPNLIKEIDECSSENCSWAEDRLKEAKDDLKEAEDNFVKYAAQLQELINGECKDYQNPCE